MFRAIFSLIIRRILTVITASGFIHVSLSAAVMTAADNDTREEPEAVITVKMLLMMSENIARNM